MNFTKVICNFSNSGWPNFTLFVSVRKCSSENLIATNKLLTYATVRKLINIFKYEILLEFKHQLLNTISETNFKEHLLFCELIFILAYKFYRGNQLAIQIS